MTKKQAHTQTPWTVSPEGAVIFSVTDRERNQGRRVAVANCGSELEPRGGLKCGDERDANAAFIVIACNNHEKLLEALKSLTKAIMEEYGGADILPVDEENDPAHYALIRAARAAIAAAEKR